MSSIDGEATSRLAATVRKRLGALALDVAFEVTAPPLAVVGPNGAGKTTLLLALLGIVHPDDGQVVLGGRTLFDRRSAVSLPPEDRHIAYVPQDYGLFPHLSASENVQFALGCRRPAPPAGQRRQEARALLDRLGAGGYADRRPAALSGGERQRVALARALATAPRALLFDEPFAALDVFARDEVRAYLRDRLADLGLPAVVVTHDRADVAALGADVLVVEAGRVTQHGPLSDLEARPATDYVARFCHQP
jgi:ABC-type sulfate/molybdate transport systems ATPase subunit